MLIVVPTLAALAFCFSCAGIITVYNQMKINGAIGRYSQHSFSLLSNKIQADMESLSGKFDDQMGQMISASVESLDSASQEAFMDLQDDLQTSLKETRIETGTTFVRLLGDMGKTGLSTGNRFALNNHVRSAHRNESVVFVIYLDTKDEPLTDFLNRESDKPVSLLPENDDIKFLIENGRKDSNTLIISDEISVDGKKAGTVVLALDMTEARENAQDVNDSLMEMLENNNVLIDSILSEQSAAISSALRETISSVQEGIKQSAHKSGEQINEAAGSAARQGNILFILGSLSGIASCTGSVVVDVKDCP